MARKLDIDLYFLMSSMKAIPTTVDSAFQKLREWYRRVGIVSKILDEGADVFELVEKQAGDDFPFPLYQPKKLRTTLEIKTMCETMLIQVWHFRDYIRNVLCETESYTKKNANKIIDQHVSLSPELQKIAYLANSTKHGEVDRTWGMDIAPALAEPMVLAPDGYGTYIGVRGEGWENLTASLAGPVIQTMSVMGSSGAWYQDARWHVEYGAASWLALLRRLKIDPWVDGEIESLIEYVRNGLIREQSRGGIPMSQLSARVLDPKNSPMLLCRWHRPPPVLTLFHSNAQYYSSPYDMSEFGWRM